MFVNSQIHFWNYNASLNNNFFRLTIIDLFAKRICIYDQQSYMGQRQVKLVLLGEGYVIVY